MIIKVVLIAQKLTMIVVCRYSDTTIRSIILFRGNLQWHQQKSFSFAQEVPPCLEFHHQTTCAGSIIVRNSSF